MRIFPTGAFFLVLAIVILPVLSSPAFASDDSASLRRELEVERQRLAEQMRLLERQMAEHQRQVERLNELERRLVATESGRAVVESGDREQSDRQRVAMSDSLETLETRQLIAADGRQDPFADERFAKSVPLAGSPWRFSFGGYAKVDLLHDFSGTGNDQEFVLSTIPVDGAPQRGSYTNLQASETRFHFEARNLGDNSPDNRLYLEFDFFDESNPTSTRLRHAYFQHDRLLAGRTWTLLTELRQLPLLLDFAAGDSILGGRTEQIRWTTQAEDKTFGWAMAVENYDDGSIYNPFDLNGKARSDFPRFTAGFTKLWDRVVWSAGGAITQLRFDGGQGLDDATDLAHTLTTAGRVYLDGDKKNWLGYGIGHQVGSVTDVITFANGRVPNASIDLNGGLDLAKAWNSQLGLHWNWTPVLSSNFSYAYAKLTEVPELYDPDLIRTGWSVHGNLIYKLNDLLTLGTEVMHGDRENVDGSSGDAQRIQFSLIYYY